MAFVREGVCLLVYESGLLLLGGVINFNRIIQTICFLLGILVTPLDYLRLLLLTFYLLIGIVLRGVKPSVILLVVTI